MSDNNITIELTRDEIICYLKRFKIPVYELEYGGTKRPLFPLISHDFGLGDDWNFVETGQKIATTHYLYGVLQYLLLNGQMK